MTEESTVEFLAGVEMFSAFRKEELEALAAQTRPQWYEFGEKVCDANDRCDGVFIIRSGTVRLFTEENGKEISMGVRKAGDVFAEIGALREHRLGPDREIHRGQILGVAHANRPRLAGRDFDAVVVASTSGGLVPGHVLFSHA